MDLLILGQDHLGRALKKCMELKRVRLHLHIPLACSQRLPGLNIAPLHILDINKPG